MITRIERINRKEKEGESINNPMNNPIVRAAASVISALCKVEEDANSPRYRDILEGFISVPRLCGL